MKSRSVRCSLSLIEMGEAWQVCWAPSTTAVLTVRISHHRHNTDNNRSGQLDFREFTLGFSRMITGTIEDKITLMFGMGCCSVVDGVHVLAEPLLPMARASRLLRS